MSSPLPSLLFSAVAATVVMLPWAVDGLPRRTGDQHRWPRTPLIVERPLTGVGGGETIRDVHQDTPFSMVALTADDLTGTSARVRAKQADGSWGPWYEAENLEGVGAATAPSARGTDPVFVGTHHRRPDRRHPAGRSAPRHRPRPATGPSQARTRLRARQRRAAARARTSTPC